MHVPLPPADGRMEIRLFLLLFHLATTILLNHPSSNTTAKYFDDGLLLRFPDPVPGERRRLGPQRRVLDRGSTKSGGVEDLTGMRIPDRWGVRRGRGGGEVGSTDEYPQRGGIWRCWAIETTLQCSCTICSS